MGGWGKAIARRGEIRESGRSEVLGFGFVLRV